MRRLQIIIACIFISSYCVYGQKIDNTTKKDSSNIYYDAVRKYANDLNADNKLTLFISNENNYSDYFKQVGLVDIKIVNPYSKEIKKIIRKKKVYEIIKISSLKVAPSGSFYINLVYFDVTIEKRKHYHFLNKGGVKIKYTYDCETKEFKFDSIEG